MVAFVKHCIVLYCYVCAPIEYLEDRPPPHLAPSISSNRLLEIVMRRATPPYAPSRAEILKPLPGMSCDVVCEADIFDNSPGIRSSRSPDCQDDPKSGLSLRPVVFKDVVVDRHPPSVL